MGRDALVLRCVVSLFGMSVHCSDVDCVELRHLDNGDDILSSLSEFTGVDGKVLELIPLGLLVDELAPGPNGMDRLQVGSRVQGRVWWRREPGFGECQGRE